MAENEFSERLNQLLSNPESLSQMMNLVMNFLPQNSVAGSPNNSSAQSVNAQGASAQGANTQGESAQPSYVPPPNTAPPYAPPYTPPYAAPPPSAPASNAPNQGGSPTDAVQVGNLLEQFFPGNHGSKSPGFKLPSSDRRSSLLTALKPYLKNERADKIDMMLKVLQMSQLAKTAFGDRH